jgi:hypothetical protein
MTSVNQVLVISPEKEHHEKINAAMKMWSERHLLHEIRRSTGLHDHAEVRRRFLP